MGSYYLIIIVISLASMWVSNTLKRKFKKYSALSLRNGMSGKEIAEKMPADHGIRDVKVISVRGSLTDHYNPKNKTVNLSESVYSQRNAAAAAVAAQHSQLVAPEKQEAPPFPQLQQATTGARRSQGPGARRSQEHPGARGQEPRGARRSKGSGARRSQELSGA